MEHLGIAGIVGLVITIAIVVRLAAGSMDGDRIANYVASRGGKLIAKNWSPFGRGWFGERSDRIYEIEYVDRDGNRRAATVKTSLFTGVYFTEDRIVRRNDAEAHENSGSELEQLRAENAALRTRLEANRSDHR